MAFENVDSKIVLVIVRPSDLIELEAIWIGLAWTENSWTGFGVLEDLNWIGLIISVGLEYISLAACG